MKKLRLVTLATTLAFLAAAPSASAATVCNEAENSFQGGYVVFGGTVDPDPPAFLRGSAMSVGGGDPANRGLLRAAEMSPALRTCWVPDPRDPGPR